MQKLLLLALAVAAVYASDEQDASHEHQLCDGFLATKCRDDEPALLHFALNEPGKCVAKACVFKPRRGYTAHPEKNYQVKFQPGKYIKNIMYSFNSYPAYTCALRNQMCQCENPTTCKCNSKKASFCRQQYKVERGYFLVFDTKTKPYKSYPPQIPHKPYKPYKPHPHPHPHKPYTPYKPHPPPNQHKPYKPYKPHPPPNPHKPYTYKPHPPPNPHKPYTPYKPHPPQKPYKPYTPYKPHYQPPQYPPRPTPPVYQPPKYEPLPSQAPLPPFKNEPEIYGMGGQAPPSALRPIISDLLSGDDGEANDRIYTMKRFLNVGPGMGGNLFGLFSNLGDDGNDDDDDDSSEGSKKNSMLKNFMLFQMMNRQQNAYPQVGAPPQQHGDIYHQHPHQNNPGQTNGLSPTMLYFLMSQNKGSKNGGFLKLLPFLMDRSKMGARLGFETLYVKVPSGCDCEEGDSYGDFNPLLQYFFQKLPFQNNVSPFPFPSLPQLPPFDQHNNQHYNNDHHHNTYPDPHPVYPNPMGGQLPPSDIYSMGAY